MKKNNINPADTCWLVHYSAGGKAYMLQSLSHETKCKYCLDKRMGAIEIPACKVKIDLKEIRCDTED
jgi:hypothetical protein